MPSAVARNAEGVRWDHLFIVDVVPERARVLDLGCGKGILLKMLVDQKHVRGTGVEIVEEKVYEAVAKGLTVYHGDLSEGLTYYPDASFDYVILSQTLQEARETVGVVKEALRVGRRAIVSFPNFGHWKSRVDLLVTGRAPVTGSLPYQWYDTPNVHFLTIKDFRIFAEEQGIDVVRTYYLGERGPLRFWPNARGAYGVFVLENKAATITAASATGRPETGERVETGRSTDRESGAVE